MKPKKEENKEVSQQLTKADCQVILQLAMSANVPLNQAQAAMASLQKLDVYARSL